MSAGGLGRVATISLVGLTVLSACSVGGDSRSEPSAFPVSEAGGNPLEADLPSAESSEPVLPDAEAYASDTVAIASTTTTAATTTTLPPATTTTIPPPVIPSDVLFESGSSELKAEAAPYLARLADEIRARHPNASLRFTGHTDSRGSQADNKRLSEERARSVMTWFVTYGFPADRLSADGAGESQLFEPDVDASGDFIPQSGARNRRVEIKVNEAA